MTRIVLISSTDSNCPVHPEAMAGAAMAESERAAKTRRRKGVLRRVLVVTMASEFPPQADARQDRQARDVLTSGVVEVVLNALGAPVVVHVLNVEVGGELPGGEFPALVDAQI